MVVTREMVGGLRPRWDLRDTGVDTRTGSVSGSSMDGRYHGERDADEDDAGTYSMGLDGSTQSLRTENTDGDDEADNEDDYVEMLYE